MGQPVWPPTLLPPRQRHPQTGNAWWMGYRRHLPTRHLYHSASHHRRPMGYHLMGYRHWACYLQMGCHPQRIHHQTGYHLHQTGQPHGQRPQANHHPPKGYHRRLKIHHQKECRHQNRPNQVLGYLALCLANR